MNGTAVGLRVLVLSPHRDDAAFSCGLLMREVLRGGSRLTIVNVCTVSDYAPYLTAEAGGPGTRVEQVTAARAAEDAVFAARLPGPTEWVDLRWKDAPLRRGIAADKVLSKQGVRQEEVDALADLLREWVPFDAVLTPLALGGHVDHETVRQAALQTFSEEQLLHYEDLPYASWMGEEQRNASGTGGLWVPRMAGGEGVKRADAACYPTQIAAAVAEEMERYVAAHGCRERLRAGAAAASVLGGLLERRGTTG